MKHSFTLNCYGDFGEVWVDGENRKYFIDGYLIDKDTEKMEHLDLLVKQLEQEKIKK